MPEYTYVLTLRAAHEATLQAGDPGEALELIRGQAGAAARTAGSIDRVELYDADGQLVLDTDPRACEACGRDEHAGFRGGQPYCHRHL